LTGKPGASEEENALIRMTAAFEVIRYFVELIEARKVEPADAFATFLINATFHGRPLENEEMINTLFILMLGGLHTVRGTLGFSMLEMTRRPEVRQRLIDEPSLIPSAVEEFLRFEAPVSTGRTVLKPFTFHDVEFQPGDRVLL